MSIMKSILVILSLTCMILLQMRMHLALAHLSEDRIQLFATATNDNITKCGAFIPEAHHTFEISGEVNAANITINSIFFMTWDNATEKALDCNIFIRNQTTPHNNTPDCSCSPRYAKGNHLFFDLKYQMKLDVNDSERTFFAKMTIYNGNAEQSRGILLPKVCHLNLLKLRDELYINNQHVNTTDCSVSGTLAKLQYNVKSTPQLSGELMLASGDSTIRLDLNREMIFTSDNASATGQQILNFTLFLCNTAMKNFSCYHQVSSTIDIENIIVPVVYGVLIILLILFICICYRNWKKKSQILKNSKGEKTLDLEERTSFIKDQSKSEAAKETIFPDTTFGTENESDTIFCIPNSETTKNALENRVQRPNIENDVIDENCRKYTVISLCLINAISLSLLHNKVLSIVESIPDFKSFLFILGYTEENKESLVRKYFSNEDFCLAIEHDPITHPNETDSNVLQTWRSLNEEKFDAISKLFNDNIFLFDMEKMQLNNNLFKVLFSIKGTKKLQYIKLKETSILTNLLNMCAPRHIKPADQESTYNIMEQVTKEFQATSDTSVTNSAKSLPLPVINAETSDTFTQQITGNTTTSKRNEENLPEIHSKEKHSEPLEIKNMLKSIMKQLENIHSQMDTVNNVICENKKKETSKNLDANEESSTYSNDLTKCLTLLSEKIETMKTHFAPEIRISQVELDAPMELSTQPAQYENIFKVLKDYSKFKKLLKCQTLKSRCP